MTRAEVLQQLRAEIPGGLLCLPGCTACCGHVPWSRAEWKLLPDEARARHTIHSLKCSFVDPENNLCSVYEHRAITCRLFGVTEDLPCPRGAIPEGVIGADKSAEIYRRYKRELFDKED